MLVRCLGIEIVLSFCCHHHLRIIFRREYRLRVEIIPHHRNQRVTHLSRQELEPLVIRVSACPSTLERVLQF